MQFYGACLSTDCPFLVLEYMQGGDLRDALSDPRTTALFDFQRYRFCCRPAWLRKSASCPVWFRVRASKKVIPKLALPLAFHHLAQILRSISVQMLERVVFRAWYTCVTALQKCGDIRLDSLVILLCVVVMAMPGTFM